MALKDMHLICADAAGQSIQSSLISNRTFLAFPARAFIAAVQDMLPD
jgi:hypothetical protein